jgi:ATP-binding cassette subfamily C protein
MLQSAVLGIGAYLVIGNEATAGIIIAAAILTARALAPVDLTIANWKGFVAARQSWRRLADHLALLPAQEAPVSLPAPAGDICVRGVSATPPGETRLVVNDVSFTLKSGQGLGIIGPSGSGKSSLARLLVGVWEVTRGEIRLDGATLNQWGPEDLGSSIGYMPQDVELFSGSVAENIARFEPNADSKDIIAAAQAAGAHEFVLGLSDGYQTPVGKNGAALSAGQQQRVALARALYRDPFLVVLDEPNSNLDAEGEQALTAAIAKIRARGGIVIIIAHRPNAISAVDQLLVMAQGRMQSFGPKDEVLAKSKRPSAPAPLLKIVAEGKGRRL